MSEDRVPVTTRVPGDQKAVWLDDADELGMSQSEFVRTMVQAGRRELDLAGDASGSAGSSNDESKPGDSSGPVEPRSPGVAPGGDGLEDRVLAVLESEGVCSWDELLETVVGDFEEQLDETMSELIESGPVTHSGLEGGYVLDE
jgi:hypothetical protein